MPYLWFGEGSLAIRVFNGLCLCVIAYVAHLAYYSFVVREESLVIKKEETRWTDNWFTHRDCFNHGGGHLVECPFSFGRKRQTDRPQT